MRQELILLSLAALFIGANQVGLVIATERGWLDLWPLGVWLCCAALGLIGLERVQPQRDRYLFPTVMLLAGWGLTQIHRLVPGFADRQALWLVIGVALLLSVCALPGHLRWLRRYRYVWLTLGLGLLAATILLGVNPSGFGPRLWLGVRSLVYFQPSEILKVILVAFLASYIADHQQLYATEATATETKGRRWPHWRFLGPMFLMWSICLVLLIWQRDLGMATLFFAVFLLMLYTASGASWVLVAGGGLFAAALSGAYFVFDVVALRVDIWLDPWANADGAAFQIVQSLFAISGGGVLGSGIGGGVPGFVPVVHTDFAYAALVEEWGLLGGLGVMAALLVIILRGLRISALLAERPFHAYLAAGLCITLAVQSLIIIGGTLNIMPLTGLTLPFVSYGGSSLLSSFINVGLLLKLSGETADPLDRQP